MYHECVICPKLGISCDGPNFVAMSAQELLNWCKQRKKHLDLSNAELAEQSGIPKGTIDRLLSGEHLDFRYETVRPLVKALVGTEWSGSPCPAPQENDNVELIEKAERFERNNKLLQEHLNREIEHHQQQLEFLRSQIKHEQAVSDGHKKAVIVLAVLLGLTVCTIIGALIVDRMNGNIGFFWLEKAFASLTAKI